MWIMNQAQTIEEGGVECPFCGESVDFYIYPDKYCSNCGQALDLDGGESE